jgi:hypothetical protein
MQSELKEKVYLCKWRSIVRMQLPALLETNIGNKTHSDTTEPQISGTIFRQRNRLTLQYFQVL